MADHLVDVVNEKDEIIGQELKSKKIEQGFISRVVAIFLIRSNRKLIVCKRADDKKDVAGLYDLAVAGNVIQWESYEEAAQRELQEELNISCPLTLLKKFYQEVHNDDKTYKIFCGVFVGKTDDIIQLNEELVESKEMNFEEVEKELTEHKEDFCPWFINDFMEVKEQLKEYCK